ncbi:hypothetical protein SPONN_284 [uncultured Candidatus Thioglobus sp.]|nr:hypothetical protein SPONN_284 [uncultured Candidatus Thioglobus sp.]
MHGCHIMTTFSSTEDWRCDQYRWVNQGVTKLPRRDPVMRKFYFSLDTPDGVSKDFQRYSYQQVNDKSVTLIHYLGDDKVVIGFPHGNRKQHQEKNFVQTCPSCLNSCRDLVTVDNASKVYKKAVANVSCNPESAPVCTPRNLKQLRNLRCRQLKQMQISHDTLYNIHEIAYDVPDFIWKITTFPDLICICGLKELLAEFERVLNVESKCQLLSYDTTFQLGDFYVSPVIFRHSLFEENPCIPAMFVIHERKFTDTHQEMWKECCKRVPSLATTEFPIVTDKEKSITNAISRELPAVRVLHCWNHILRDVQFWLRKHGAPKGDIAIYCENLRNLFHCLTEADYQKLLIDMRKDWDVLFEAYYMKEIHPDVPESVGRWALEKYSVYNPYSGVTNNQSESLNRQVLLLRLVLQ